jgi:hypothetical protein
MFCAAVFSPLPLDDHAWSFSDVGFVEWFGGFVYAARAATAAAAGAACVVSVV